MDATSAHQDSLPVTSDALIARLDGMGISYDRFDHVPLMTVQDSKAVQGVMRGPDQGGVHIKNLYLRDRKKRNFLVTLEQDRDYAFRIQFDETSLDPLLADEASPLGSDRGPTPSRLLLASALGGAAMILASDIAVRLIAPDQDLKLGVLTALVGAPFFLHLLWKLRGVEA